MLSKDPRKLSRFIAQEMLYDYTQNRLDSERMQAIQSYLKQSPELRQDLNTLIEAERYADNIAETRISLEHLNELNNIRPLRAIVIEKIKWKNWPELFKWTAEALLISTVVAIGAMLVPWDKINLNFPQREAMVTLVEVNKKPVPTQAPEPTKASALVKIAATNPPLQDNINLAQDEEVNVDEAASKQKVIPLKGMLYRVMITAENSQKIADEVKLKIDEIGGTKAGQVELGWRKKNPDGNYFHFVFAADKYDQLIKMLGSYSSIRIYKNPHERVMPDGQLRMILWIEDKIPEEQVQ
ncbi:MAG: hypothetical protein A2Z20_09960 [Bdellovibrionales bacterium RBG_16_40_8]|nr:MAG: hypothetical protein A2Z20_09960 [Bdellovibrionales bacterium RBG_16_40_8]